MTTTTPVAHLDDRTLLEHLATLVRRDHSHTAQMLTHLGEVDARGLFAAQGHPSMFRFCVDQLHMSEGTAYKRIGAARVTRRHPEVLVAIAAGRLHLSAVVLLAPHLNAHNVDELIEAAAHRSKQQVEHLLAERFPKPDMPTRVRILVTPASGNELSPGTVHGEVTLEFAGPESAAPAAHDDTHALLTGTSDTSSTSLMSANPDSGRSNPPVMPPALSLPTPPTRVHPTAPQRYALQTTLDEQAHADLRAIQALLSNRLPSHDLGEVLGHALALCREVLEKQRACETEAPRSPRATTSRDARHVPAHVRRVVWRRDEHRCTFIGPTGRRCEARSFLELDHITPVARGGTGHADNLRVRCRAHNQYEAEQAYGRAFMLAKRAHGASAAGT